MNLGISNVIDKICVAEKYEAGAETICVNNFSFVLLNDQCRFEVPFNGILGLAPASTHIFEGLGWVEKKNGFLDVLSNKGKVPNNSFSVTINKGPVPSFLTLGGFFEEAVKGKKI